MSSSQQPSISQQSSRLRNSDSPRRGRVRTHPIRIISVCNSQQHTDGSHETSHQHAAPAGREVCVFLGREDSENVVVFVQGLAVVTAFLLVPPVAVRIAELALDGEGGGERGVGVIAILQRERERNQYWVWLLVYVFMLLFLLLLLLRGFSGGIWG